MHHRTLGATGLSVSEVGLGTWQTGGDRGSVPAERGRGAVRTALDAGIDVLDTADVCGDGRSERLIADVLDGSDREDVVVATKAGRRLDPHSPTGTRARTSSGSSTGPGRTTGRRCSTRSKTCGQRAS
jgi:aryl-alcohol dehydrogenase-like predicted oxidoreductase